MSLIQKQSSALTLASAAFISLSAQAVLNDTLDRSATRKLRSLISHYPSASPAAARYQMRLGQSLASWAKKVQIEAEQADNAILRKQANSKYQEAGQIFRGLIESGRLVGDNDRLLFDLAFVQREQGLNGLSDQSLSQLVKDYPQSKLLSEAHLILGDSSFDAGVYDTALGHYQHALVPALDSKRKDYIELRQAWCQFQIGHVTVATEQVFKAGFMGQDGAYATESKDAFITFAIRSKSESAEKLAQRFGRIDRDSDREIFLTGLISAAIDAGDENRYLPLSQLAFEQLLPSVSWSNWRVSRMDAHSRSGELSAAAVRELSEWDKMLQLEGSFALKVGATAFRSSLNERNEFLRKRAQAALRGYLKKASSHQQARVESWYGVLLRHEARSTDLHTYADFLFDRKQAVRADRLYGQLVAKTAGPKGDKKLLLHALKRRLFFVQTQIASVNVKKDVNVKLKEAEQKNKWIDKFASLSQALTKTFPAEGVSTRSRLTLAGYRASQGRFRQVVGLTSTLDPKGLKAAERKSWVLLRVGALSALNAASDILNFFGRYGSSLSTWVPESIVKLNGVRLDALLSQAQKVGTAGKVAESIRFLSMVVSDPDSSLKQKSIAHWNLSVLRAKQFDLSATRAHLLAVDSTSEHYAPAADRLFRLAMKTGDLEMARSILPRTRSQCKKDCAAMDDLALLLALTEPSVSSKQKKRLIRQVSALPLTADLDRMTAYLLAGLGQKLLQQASEQEVLSEDAFFLLSKMKRGRDYLNKKATPERDVSLVQKISQVRRVGRFDRLSVKRFGKAYQAFGEWEAALRTYLQSPRVEEGLALIDQFATDGASLAAVLRNAPVPAGLDRVQTKQYQNQIEAQALGIDQRVKSITSLRVDLVKNSFWMGSGTERTLGVTLPALAWKPATLSESGISDLRAELFRVDRKSAQERLIHHEFASGRWARAQILARAWNMPRIQMTALRTWELEKSKLFPAVQTAWWLSNKKQLGALPGFDTHVRKLNNIFAKKVADAGLWKSDAVKE